ncbi:ATP-binding protein [Dyadobacter sediminis]|uniref:histidine kinase n=1 Tax=Dyadobacter sediminis TaxID=1493691 RepID=A0A5R9K8A1_9BACT|nr:ATP-binding protein [Dyadobacter sediminis]TLU90316.1 response regulator [Dyadobacter sediminis]GGC06812.1 hypothetical protein GCM10011325_37060 [Dyadobacter sediminis]
MNSIPHDFCHITAQQRTLLQNEAFQAAINGESLVNVLNILAQLVKLELGSDVRTAFYLAYPDGKRLHAIEGAGDMAPSYTAPLNGFPVSDDSFCSGYAIATGRTVHTPDVFKDPHWQPYLPMAIAHGFCAASSYPILTRQGKAIGSLALYFPHFHQATAQEESLAKAITQAAVIILSQDTQTLEHTRAQEALSKSEAEFRTITEAAPALVWVCSASGENIYFNQRWYDYTGQTYEQASGHGWMLTMHPDDAARILPYWQRCQQTGESYEGEVRYERYDGVYRWHIFRALPRRNSAGQIEAWYGLSIDTDDAKQAQEGLLKADRRKDEFLAMLAHELRNPMSTIRSGLHILDLTITEDMNRSTLEMMRRQTEHLVRMVDDLLDVSRIDRGKIDLKTGRVNLVEIVGQAAESVHSVYQQQGKRLHIDLPQAAIYLEGDATRLTQVVTNLLTNGARYTGERGQVWVSVRYHNNEAILQVRDNGIGLATDQLSAIFELFVQVDNSLARSKGGLGLGLTLVKRLVEMHGGRVEAQSEGIGKGSSFTVHLPMLGVTGMQLVKPALQIAESAIAKRILVIDDNADAGLMMAMLLNIKGYEAHTRTSGRAGIEAAQEVQPAAILLDIGMPGLDGYATCGLIRQQAWGQAVVVIAVTGYGQDGDRQRTKEAGFDGHLVKPVDLESMTSLLTGLLDKRYKSLEQH